MSFPRLEKILLELGRGDDIKSLGMNHLDDQTLIDASIMYIKIMLKTAFAFQTNPDRRNWHPRGFYVSELHAIEKQNTVFDKVG